MEEENLITLCFEPQKLDIAEQKRLSKKYQNLLSAYDTYDPWTSEKVEGMTKENYLFIRKVYAKQNVMIPWVEY